MNGINLFMGLGRVGNDPVITTQQGPNGQFKTARFLLMTSRVYMQDQTDTDTGEVTREKKEVTEPIVIQATGKRAEVVAQYLKKGDPVFITGRFDLNSWVDKQTNEKKQSPQIIADGIELIPKGKESTPAQDAKAALALISEAEVEAGVTELLGLKKFLFDRSKAPARAAQPTGKEDVPESEEVDPFQP